MLITDLYKCTNWNDYFSFLNRNPKCFYQHFSKVTSNKQYSIPAISAPAFEMIDIFLTPDMEVLDFGSNAIFYFAKKSSLITSIQTDKKRVSDIEQQNLEYGENILLKYIDVKTFTGNHSVCLSFTGKKKYDLIFIDCIENESFSIRPAIFTLAQNHIKSGGLIILNHSWRYQYRLGENKAKYSLSLPGRGTDGKMFSQTDIYFF